MLTDVAEKRIFKQTLRLMGNRFEITVVTNDDQEANLFIGMAVTEIRRIESLLTTFSDDSETALINAAAGIRPVSVSNEVYDLIERSVRISDLTQGAFDITYGSVDKRLWNFDTTMTALPDPLTARKMVALVNYKNIILNKEHNTVFLKEKGMRIGFGGIGKGYAAEMAKRLLQQHGVESGIINAAGDLATWGTTPDGKPWTIGIADPNNKHHPFSALKISDMAVATSGNYEKFVMIDGKRYSHTIDPKTGLPVTGIKSVTMICPNAEIADAMATPVMIMGVKAGLDMVNQIRHLACIIVDDSNRVFTSENLMRQP